MLHIPQRDLIPQYVNVATGPLLVVGVGMPFVVWRLLEWKLELGVVVEEVTVEEVQVRVEGDEDC